MEAIITLFLLLLIAHQSVKSFTLEKFIYAAFIVNLAIDLFQFEQVAGVVASLRALFFYFFFVYHFARRGLKRSDLVLWILVVYTLVGVSMSSDIAHSIRFMLRVFVPFFLMALTYRVKAPLQLFNRLRRSMPWVLVIFIIYTVASNLLRFGVETYGSSAFMTGFLFGADLHFFALAALVTLTTVEVGAAKKSERKLWEVVVSVLTIIILLFTLRRTSMFIVLVGIGFMNVVSVKHFITRLVPIGLGLGLVIFFVASSDMFKTRLEARAEKFNVESLEEEARYLEVGIIQKEVLSFDDFSRSMFGYELFNSVGNYADGKFKGRMIHVDYFTWLHGGGVIGLFIYLAFLMTLPRIYKMPFFLSDMKSTHLRLFWFLFIIQFVISVSGQMYIISFRSFIFIYMALLARSYNQIKNGVEDTFRKQKQQTIAGASVRT